MDRWARSVGVLRPANTEHTFDESSCSLSFSNARFEASVLASLEAKKLEFFVTFPQDDDGGGEVSWVSRNNCTDTGARCLETLFFHISCCNVHVFSFASSKQLRGTFAALDATNVICSCIRGDIAGKFLLCRFPQQFAMLDLMFLHKITRVLLA